MVLLSDALHRFLVLRQNISCFSLSLFPFACFPHGPALLGQSFGAFSSLPPNFDVPDVNSIQARLVSKVDLASASLRGMDQVNGAIARLDDGAKRASLGAEVCSRYGAFDLCQGLSAAP